MKTLFRHLLPLFLIVITGVSTVAEHRSPVLRHVFDIHARCGKQYGPTETNGINRVVIPITGGTVDGDITAEILPGGSDWQTINPATGRAELCATYCIKTEDGAIIEVCNEGIIYPDEKNYYFTTSPKFKAPSGSSYDWLNNRIFVCKPIGFEDGMVHLRIWVVE